MWSFLLHNFCHNPGMPELPEVETIKRGLAKELVGHTVSSVDVRVRKEFVGDEQKLIGQKVADLERRAKLLIIKFQDYYLVTHLKMTGQLVFVPKQGLGSGHWGLDKKAAAKNQSPVASSQSLPSANWVVGGHPDKVYTADLPHKHTHVIIEFDNGTLYFNDLRKFGWMKLVSTDEELKPLVENLGVEYDWPEYTLEYFTAKLAKRSNVTIKQALLEQTLVAGIGNIYADEALFLANIRPTRKVSSLKPAEIEKLFGAIPAVFELSLSYGGTSSQHYIKHDGTKGKFLEFANVYKREGEPCRVCGTPIERTKIAGRSSHFCPHCQK